LPTANPTTRELVRHLFDVMLEASGPRAWWPAERTGVREGMDEIVIGAVLTQNTAWKNVVQALAALRAEGLLDLEKLAAMDAENIAPLIKPSGYYNLKSKRLKAVAEFFAPGGKLRLHELETWPTDTLRQSLIAVYGVGPETADSILLYALGRLSFVIDAYTLRIGRRHGVLADGDDYESSRAIFSRSVDADVARYNEYHALLVWIGNNFCRPTPLCFKCPLSQRDCFAKAKDWNALARFREQK
jgi:endonuclease-3 related protein